MAKKHTFDELNNCSREELITMVLMMQGQLDDLNENISQHFMCIIFDNEHSNYSFCV